MNSLLEPSQELVRAVQWPRGVSLEVLYATLYHRPAGRAALDLEVNRLHQFYRRRPTVQFQPHRAAEAVLRVLEATGRSLTSNLRRSPRCYRL